MVVEFSPWLSLKTIKSSRFEIPFPNPIFSQLMNDFIAKPEFTVEITKTFFIISPRTMEVLRSIESKEKRFQYEWKIVREIISYSLKERTRNLWVNFGLNTEQLNEWMNDGMNEWALTYVAW